MKSNLLNSVLLCGALCLGLSACNKESNTGQESGTSLRVLSVSTEGISTYNLSNLTPVFDSTAALTADQIEFLYAVREDEKIGKDFYAAMVAKFPRERLILRFAQSEVNHIAAIETLLNYYEIQYPALTNPGIFADATRQSKYDAMIADAVDSMSVFRIAANLEEENYIAYSQVAADSSNINLYLIVKHMVKCSANHLRALVHHITVKGGTYTPLYLSAEAYSQLIHNPFDKGDKQKRKGDGNKGTNSGKKGEPRGPKGSLDNQGNCTDTVSGSKPTPDLPGGEPGKGYRGGHVR